MLLILHLPHGLELRLICFTGTNIDHISETPLNSLTARSDQMKLLPIISLRPIYTARLCRMRQAYDRPTT